MKTAPHSAFEQTLGSQRPTLTFSVEGLAAREELLFKGYVRLLDHVTDHQWRYREPSHMHRVDLLVVEEHVKPTVFADAKDLVQPVLQLGTSGPSRLSFLSWPLQPGELEKELNRLGRLIETQAAHETAAPDADADTENDTYASDTLPTPLEPVQEPSERQYRLSQWPRPTLLSEPGRMRLATLLTGKAMSLDELMFRSALPKKVCERFLEDMQTAGLILHPGAANSQGPAWLPPAVRKARLEAQHEKHAVQPAAKSVTQPSLLARIRMRFGIKNPGSH